MSLRERVIQGLIENRKNVIEGHINCIPSPFKRFSQTFPGIQQGKYYLVSANTKVGKSQIANFMFVYNPLLYAFFHQNQIQVKIYYFNLEEDREDIYLRYISYLLYILDKIEIDAKDLQSIRENKPLPQHIIELLESPKYQELLDWYEQCVEFRNERHPTGINNAIKAFCKDHGTIHYKPQQIIDNITGEIKTINAFDYYEPDNKNLYFIPIIDHISLLTLENGMTIKGNIDLLSSQYLVKLRNRFKCSPVVIQQQAADMENLDRIRSNKLRPTLNGLGESKATGRDVNIMLGLFSPYRHEIPEYLGYDITSFKDNIRFLEVVIDRNGESNAICPLYFKGACNFFKELPLPNDPKINEYYNKQIVNLLLTPKKSWKMKIKDLVKKLKKHLKCKN